MRLRRSSRRLFPGSRQVWIAALAVVLVTGGGITRFYLGQPLPLTGTNSVDAAAVIGRAAPGQQTCIKNLVVPARTGRISIFIGISEQSFPQPLLTGTLRAADGRQWHFSRQLVNNRTGFFRDFELSPRPTGPNEFPATACFRVGLASIDLGGAKVNRFPDTEPSTVGGKPITGSDVSVRFLTRKHTGTRRITRLDDAVQRATLFKDLPGNSTVIWLLLVGFATGVPYLAIRTAATVRRLSVRTMASRAVAVATFAGIAWALMLPPLHGADESEHLAYVQYVAETGHRADAGPTKRQPYSSDELLLMGAIRHSSTVVDDTSRVRWDPVSEGRYLRALRESTPRRDDGGGYTDSASGHSPLYYALLAIPYRMVAGHLNLVQTSIILRLSNAVLAALVAGLAVWTAALLLPRWPETWWLAGVLAGLQPVFSSISGTINNDTLVNLLSATAVTAVVHAWRKGPSRTNMAALATSAALLPVAKITGFALWPALAFGILIIGLRHHRRADLFRMSILPFGVLAVVAVWVYVSAPLLGGDQGRLVNVHTAGPTIATNVASTAGVTMAVRVNYLVQMFVPFIHLGRDVWGQAWPVYSVYIKRGYGRFGWLDVGLPSTWLTLVTISLIGGWIAAAAAAIRHRATWRHWAPGVAFLCAVIIAVIAFVAAAYAVDFTRAIPGEQGRYIFPALVPMATLFAGGLGIVSSRLRAGVLGAAVSATSMFALFAWTAALMGYYS